MRCGVSMHLLHVDARQEQVPGDRETGKGSLRKREARAGICRHSGCQALTAAQFTTPGRLSHRIQSWIMII